MSQSLPKPQCLACLCLLDSSGRCLNHDCIAYSPPQGFRSVMGGMYEKSLDTGEIRERPLYTRIDEFPG